jgi:hypothetical protein
MTLFVQWLRGKAYELLFSHAIGVSLTEGLAVREEAYDAVCPRSWCLVRGPGCEGGRLMVLFAHAIGVSEGLAVREGGLGCCFPTQFVSLRAWL